MLMNLEDMSHIMKSPSNSKKGTESWGCSNLCCHGKGRKEYLT